MSTVEVKNKGAMKNKAKAYFVLHSEYFRG